MAMGTCTACKGLKTMTIRTRTGIESVPCSGCGATGRVPVNSDRASALLQDASGEKKLPKIIGRAKPRPAPKPKAKQTWLRPKPPVNPETEAAIKAYGKRKKK